MRFNWLCAAGLCLAPPPDAAIAQEQSASAKVTLELRQIAGGFEHPSAIVANPVNGKKLYVLELSGRISVIVKDKVLRKPLLDITNKVGSGEERGLVSMALPPDWPRSRVFFVNYVNKHDFSIIARYEVPAGNRNRADTTSARTVIKLSHPAFITAPTCNSVPTVISTSASATAALRMIPVMSPRTCGNSTARYCE